MHTKFVALLATTWALACGPSTPAKIAPLATPSGDAFAAYAALEVGADYKNWPRLNTEPFVSKTHGGRFVNVYVNDVGRAAYLADDAEIPVGTVVVKDSWEVSGGEKTDVAGPVFVMEKKSPGFDADNNDWWYALHWEEVPAGTRGVPESQVYWRTPSKKVNYCSGCHGNYDRELGGTPPDALAPEFKTSPVKPTDATKPSTE